MQTTTCLRTTTYRLLTLACSAPGMFAMTPAALAEVEPEHPVKPLLWKIEGKDLTQPSHLFGTIHISKGPAVTLHPAAQMAFDGSSHFHAEVPLDMASQMATMPLMMRKDGKTLDEAIGKDLAAGLNAELKLINPALASHFFAAGAGHFLGEINISTHLVDAGYTVTRIER